jgi:hypothetical protein
MRAPATGRSINMSVRNGDRPASRGPGDGSPDLKALGRFIEARRIEVGLRPGELAIRAGWRDASIGGGTVRAFEQRGSGTLDTICRVLKALDIDDGAVKQVSGLDLAELRSGWEQWADEPVPVSVSVRFMPAVWARIAPPEGLTHEGVLAWAIAHPQARHCLCCIRWSRRHCTYLRPDGTSYEVHASFPDDCPEPWMSLA